MTGPQRDSYREPTDTQRYREAVRSAAAEGGDWTFTAPGSDRTIRLSRAEIVVRELAERPAADLADLEPIQPYMVDCINMVMAEYDRRPSAALVALADELEPQARRLLRGNGTRAGGMLEIIEFMRDRARAAR